MFTKCIALMFLPFPNQGASDLELTLSMQEPQVLECLPIVVRLTVTNNGDSDEPVRFDAGTTEGLLAYSSAFLEDAAGTTYRLSHTAGPQASTVALPARFTLEPKQSVSAEMLALPVVRKPLDRWSGKELDTFEFAKAGTYEVHYKAEVRPGLVLISNRISIELQTAVGVDAKARERLTIAVAGFFEGRDAPPDEASYHDGKWWRRVDVSRFQEVQRILEDFPNSEYAEWIRFWKVHHHGAPRDAIEYARTHSGFPLADNLMLRAAEQFFNAGEYAQARTTLTELDVRFPDGDARHLAGRTRKHLANKP